jgi:hypothetical protein
VVITAHQARSYVAFVTTEDRPHHPAPEYEIRVAGHLAPRWSAWFDGLTVTTDADGTTVLHGTVIDQAALHGLLQKLRDVGIPLVSLHQVPSGPVNEPPAHTSIKEN